MTYELAKQLEAAGFPQKGHQYFYDNNGMKQSWQFCRGQEGIPHGLVRECLDPQLSELIEACRVADGEWKDFALLWRGTFVWEARVSNCFTKHDLLDGTMGVGATPEEAVARLWLALNQSKKVESS